MAATEVGNKNIVKILIKHGADIYIEGEEGMSALSLAAENSRDDIISLLLGSSSDSEMESEIEDDESESEKSEQEDDKSGSGTSDLSESEYELYEDKVVSEKGF